MECPVLKQIAHEKGKTIAQVNIAKTKENGIYYSLHFFSHSRQFRTVEFVLERSYTKMDRVAHSGNAQSTNTLRASPIVLKNQLVNQ